MLRRVKKDETLRKDLKQKLENEYMNSFMSKEEFGKKYYISYDTINYYYYYLKDKGIPFEEQIKIPYKVGGEDHSYFCDFKRLDTGELIEIKNPAMVDEEGNLILLFKSSLSEKRIEVLQGQLKEKKKCMERNNIKILNDEKYFAELERLLQKSPRT